jgi:hypothetical protein
MITYPPIKFECKVSGRELIAEVITEEVNPGQFNFNTTFSDGFSDIFSHDERSGIWTANKDAEEAYLNMIQDDLSALQCYQVGRHYLSFRHPLEKEPVNIWVFETQREDLYMMYSKGGCKRYTVYYNGDYRFEMKKVAGAWRAKTVRHHNPVVIDENLVAKIGQIIDEKIKD